MMSLWMVIDRDSQSWDESQIAEIAKLCQQKKLLPCLE